jgi:outer membrane scaffolding protein for murein synthesis (MipA/OmpV family)
MVLKNLALLLFISYVGFSFADEEPVFELGMGLGGLSVPHYRGSDQREQFVVPFPYIKFSSKNLKIDREGGRYYLYDFGNSKLDVSMDFAFPVNSDKNIARQAMPDLKAVVEIGPRLMFYPYTSDDSKFRIRFAFPVRLAIATNIIETNTIGGTFSPYIQFRFFNYVETAVTIGPYWATEKYHDNFYQVDTQYVTAQRPYYDAKGGYGGSRISLTSSKRFKKYWVGIFARYDFLDRAVYQDSPLVKQKTALLVGFGVSYVFDKIH